MNNPWLDVDLTDYVNHMSSPEIGQYQMINDSFKTILGKLEPARIFVPGCTIGNGFEYINWDKVKKVTALDVNPDFLKVLREKFHGRQKLEIIEGDFGAFSTQDRRYDLIFSALFFEYVDVKQTLIKFHQMMDITSVLFSIVQLPGEGQSKVSQSKFKSLEKLGPYISLSTAGEFTEELSSAGFRIKSSSTQTLANGKSFFITEAVTR